MNPIPPPPPDTVTLLLEVQPDDIHFVDNILKGHDHIAQVRRDMRLHRGRPCFEVHVPPHFLDEVRRVLDRLRELIWIGQVVVLPPEPVHGSD